MSYLLYDVERPVIKWGPRERARFRRYGYVGLEGYMLYAREPEETAPYLGLGGTAKEIDKNLKPFLASADWQTVLGTCQMIEALLGRQTWNYRPSTLAIFASKDFKREAKNAKAFLKKKAAEADASGVSGLGQALSIGVGLAIKGISLVRSIGAGRKAAQKARVKARGAERANDYLQILSWRWLLCMEQLGRIGLDPPDAPTSAEWLNDFQNRLWSIKPGKLDRGDPSVTLDNILAFFRQTLPRLQAVPAWTAAEEARARQPQPVSPVQTALAPAETAAVTPAPSEQTVPAAAPVAPKAVATEQKSAAPALIGLSLVGLLLRGGF